MAKRYNVAYTATKMGKTIPKFDSIELTSSNYDDVVRVLKKKYPTYDIRIKRISEAKPAIEGNL